MVDKGRWDNPGIPGRRAGQAKCQGIDWSQAKRIVKREIKLSDQPSGGCTHEVSNRQSVDTRRWSGDHFFCMCETIGSRYQVYDAANDYRVTCRH
jgi:hypothetical protein